MKKYSLLIMSLFIFLACEQGTPVATPSTTTDDSSTDDDDTDDTDDDNESDDDNDTDNTDDNESDDDDDTDDENEDKSTQKYDINIEFTWSSSNNTSTFGSFPVGPHFSPVTGSIHKNGESIYKTGTIASRGIEIMAETGGTSTLVSEIQTQISDGEAKESFVGGGITSSPSSPKFIATVQADDDFHYFSVVSMIAPSPDWFIASRNVNLKDGEGNWLKEITLMLPGYDAGTDDGATFTSPNDDANPKQNITRFTGADDIIFATLTLTRKE